MRGARDILWAANDEDEDEIKEAMMGRKVALTTAAVLAVVLSVVLMGGEVGKGRFFELGNHEPIYIYGDDGFTVEKGVVSGCGTAEAPYIIEGWQIDAPKADYGIYVDHTTVHFVVRDCTVERARLAGVYFNTVRNGRVERSKIGLSDTAVYLLNSAGNTFRRNVVADSLYGIVMGARSKDNVVAGNAFLGNGMNGYDPYNDNLWSEDCRGNYWSDYTGPDHDGDGIGDVPYYRVYDPRPLMAPPIDECDEPETVEAFPTEETPPVTEPETAEPEGPATVEEVVPEPESPAEEEPAVIESEEEATETDVTEEESAVEATESEDGQPVLGDEESEESGAEDEQELDATVLEEAPADEAEAPADSETAPADVGDGP